MRYYKHIKDNIIDYIGTGDGAGVDISEIDYNTIQSLFDNRPDNTDTHYYVLKADTLEYEAIEREEPIEIAPDPYQEGYDQAILDLIEQGVL